MINFRQLNILFSFLLFATILVGQNDLPQKEIIIIEKTVDDQGNVITKSTKRYSGQYTEDEIQDLLEDPNEQPDIRSYDLDGLGFEENFQDLFRSDKNTRPTIGVNLDFENGRAIVVKVHPNSGASDSDIRVGDEIISIMNLPVSTIDDVYEVLEKKSSGDKIKVIIFRDGEEMEKEVRLSRSGRDAFSFDFGDAGSLRMFDNDDFGLSFDLDSLFEGFFGSERLFMDPRQGNNDDGKSYNRDIEEERPSLGVFIEESGLEVMVAEVVKESPAEKSGVETGDIILSLDGNIVTSFREVSAYMNRKRKGESMTLEVKRNGTIKTLKVTL